MSFHYTWWAEKLCDITKRSDDFWSCAVILFDIFLQWKYITFYLQKNTIFFSQQPFGAFRAKVPFCTILPDPMVSWFLKYEMDFVHQKGRTIWYPTSHRFLQGRWQTKNYFWSFFPLCPCFASFVFWNNGFPKGKQEHFPKNILAPPSSCFLLPTVP